MEGYCGKAEVLNLFCDAGAVPQLPVPGCFGSSSTALENNFFFLGPLLPIFTGNADRRSGFAICILHNKNRIRICMERYKSGSSPGHRYRYMVNVQKPAIKKQLKLTL